MAYPGRAGESEILMSITIDLSISINLRNLYAQEGYGACLIPTYVNLGTEKSAGPIPNDRVKRAMREELKQYRRYLPIRYTAKWSRENA